jgi:hypothetical protein
MGQLLLLITHSRLVITIHNVHCTFTITGILPPKAAAYIVIHHTLTVTTGPSISVQQTVGYTQCAIH